MTDPVRRHYERWPYPHYPLLAAVRPEDTYALNLDALYARFNGVLPAAGARRILLAGCGSFSPYPTALANPGVPLTALDLSGANLHRARLHTLLHGCRGITFERGDLLDPAAASESYGFIDCFGVLHHLADPLAGLRALERRLAPGGILRLMVYSRGGRRGAESIRKALRLLGVGEVAAVKRLLRRAAPDSRFRRYADALGETRFPAGLADAFLHPRARTFRIDDLLALVADTGLEPLRFAHAGALAEPGAEAQRLRQLEAERCDEPNFILYLGRQPAGGCGLAADARLLLNPALRRAVVSWRLGSLAIPPRLGRENPRLDRAARRFLLRFARPVAVAELTAAERAQAQPFVEALFLVPFRG